ncbi:MAG: efflux RND transporter permease subunit, partial [Bacteroidota bacterium]
FLAILAATLTSVGALMVIFLLEEYQKLNLWDFALVIAINISVSLVISLYYIPALLETMDLGKKRQRFSQKRKRRILKFTKGYSASIDWIRLSSLKWLFFLLFILGFGMPIHLLPKNMENHGFWADLYNDTLGTEWFLSELRPTLEKILGGSLRLFTEEVYENSYYIEPQRTSLKVTGAMPDGCTIEQLNEVIQKMENYIGSFDQVSLFKTQINSPKKSRIIIYFDKDHEYGYFPYTLKSLLEQKAISLGGLDWSIYGVGLGFSNALGAGYKSNRITLEGYNYDELYDYALVLKKQLITNSNGRAKDVEITSGDWDSTILNEFYLKFNSENLAMDNVYQGQVYGFLKNQTHSEILQPIIQNGQLQQVKLVSDNYRKFNIWDLRHTPISIQNKPYKLKQPASLEKRKTGNIIKKNNQKYRLTVAYDFLGPQALAKKVRENNLNELKSKLPIGYRVQEQYFQGWNKEDTKQYYYLFVVIAIMFFICAILLESIRQPLWIICMIPIAFIGVFLTFYIFDFNFDQGGYASFILLSGISVNAALFILNDYNNLKKQYPKRNHQLLYYKAFNYKIIPIVLTITSTIVGLLPFVWYGQNEVFWFSFAVGSIGGLLFSLIGIFVYLPLLEFCKILRK